MSTPVDVRFIPLWLSKVISYYNADPKEFESIVSKHDVALYKVANNLLRSKLQLFDVRDFNFPDGDINAGFTTEDAVFALFGKNPAGKALAEFQLTHFDIIPDKYDGILLVERESGDEKDLLAGLLSAIALYRGKPDAYASSCFRIYLGHVNKDQGRHFTAKEFHERLKERLKEQVTGNDEGDNDAKE